MADHDVQPPRNRTQSPNVEPVPESEFGFLRDLFSRGYSRENLVTYGLLAFVLLIAWAVRLVAARQGLPYLTVHDEPELAGTALRMMQTGELNPQYFNYGSLMMYTNLAVDVLHYFYLLGQPLDAPNHIRHLDELMLGAGDYRWQVSHPSFILWNRWVVGLMGTASAGLVFAIGRMILNRWAGLIGAAFLATTLFHVEHSAVITNDIPVSFFVLLAVFFTLLYLRNASAGYLITAFAVCGLAAACKYNAVLSVFIPLTALVLSYLLHLANSEQEPERTSGYRHWLWIALLLAPPIFFLIGMPYALLDLPEFLLGAGWEVVHYKHIGHGADTVGRGLPFLRFQVGNFFQNLGSIGMAFIAFGAFYLSKKRLGWVLLLFPVLYLLYMSTMIVSFHRNFLLLYPIAAIAFGIGVALIGEEVLARINRADPKQVLPLVALVFVLLAGYFAARLFDVAHYSRNISRQPETRTEVISRINELIADSATPNAMQIGIAQELRIHPQDLNRLTVTASVLPHMKLVEEFNNFDVIVTGGKFADGLDSSDADATTYNAVMTTLPRPAQTLDGREVVFLADWPVTNPTLLLYIPQ